MPEWSNGLAWKASVRLKPYRGFESLSLRQNKKARPKAGPFCFVEREGAENPRQGSTGHNDFIGRKADRGTAWQRCAAVRAMEGSHQSLRDAEYPCQITPVAGFFMAEREGAEKPRQGSTGHNDFIGRKADRGAAWQRCAAVRAMEGSYQSLCESSVPLSGREVPTRFSASYLSRVFSGS